MAEIPEIERLRGGVTRPELLHVMTVWLSDAERAVTDALARQRREIVEALREDPGCLAALHGVDDIKWLDAESRKFGSAALDGLADFIETETCSQVARDAVAAWRVARGERP